MKKISCFTILFLISCASIAGTPFPFSEQGWNSSEKKTINENYLWLSGIVVGTTTLDEVVEVFGQSKLYRPNKKNYSPNLLCYKSDLDDASVIFQSGPLGGWKVVTAIWIGNVNFIDATLCAKSKLVDRKKMSVNGLSLDLGIADVENIIGNPTFQNASFLAYRYKDKTTLDEGKIFDISSGFEFDFNFNKQRLNWFRIYQQLSN